MRSTLGWGVAARAQADVPGEKEETVDWRYDEQSYSDEHTLARAILEGGQPAVVHLDPLAFRVTWKETELPAEEDWQYIVRRRTIKMEASAREAAAQDGSPLTTLIEDLGEISREHDVAYANAKPSSGEIVNQAECEEQLGDLLRRVHENVHALQHVA